MFISGLTSPLASFDQSNSILAENLIEHEWNILVENHDLFLYALLTTVELWLLSCAIGTAVGVILGIIASLDQKYAINRVLSGIVTVYVGIIRGVPLMILAFFIFFGLPQTTGLPFDEFVAGVIILSINCSAYIVEIVRGGIRAVARGQKEAGLSIGLTFPQLMTKIILPQAVRIMFPQFVSQYIITLKDTTIISAIGLVELLMAGRKIVGRTFDSLNVYGLIAVFFLIIVTVLTYISKNLEKKYNPNV